MAQDYFAQKEFEERVIQTKRVSKTTKGGRKIGFTALVVAGDKKGKVGSGLGKAPNIATAIQKAINMAKKDMLTVKITKHGSISHEVRNKYKASSILLRPAPEGSGVIAGGAVRHVVELAGIKNISAKLIGSNNKGTSVKCTLDALSKLKE